jgi:serine/threonine protein kinase
VALELGRDLLGGLAYLHDLGFVHHDVKLANFLVMVDRPTLPLDASDGDVLRAVAEGRGRGVLIDLGGARSVAWLQDRAQGRADDQLVPPQLTPLYSPPEALLRDDAGDTALDVYAAGLVLYAMVTGHLPYDHLPGFTPRERDAGAYQDLGRLLDVKAAERCGEVSPISREAVERLPLHDVRMTQGATARRRFVADLQGFIEALVHPDPRERPSASQARDLLLRTFRFHGPCGRERQGAVSMNPLSNRLVDAARPAGAAGGIERISVRPGLGARRGGRVA